MLGGVRKLINAMGDDDQLMLYDSRQYRVRAAGNVGQEPDVHKTLGSIKQVEGSLDTARLISAV